MSELLRKLETPQRRAEADAADKAQGAADAMAHYRAPMNAEAARILQRVAAESTDKSARVYTQREVVHAMELAQAPLLALAERVARLNPRAGTMGPGMLASLVEVATALCATAVSRKP